MKDLPQLISKWRSAIDPVKIGSALEPAWAAESAEEHIKLLAEGVKSIQESIAKLGDCARDVLSNASQDTDPELLPAYLVNYVWPEEAKCFLLLLRNVIFEQHKAVILALEEEVDQDSLVDLRKRSQAKVEHLATELSTFLEEEVEGSVIAELKGDPKLVKKSIRRWRLQKNPWPLYKEQISKIPLQCDDLVKQHGALVEAMEHLLVIRESVTEMVQRSRKEISALRTVSAHALKAIAEEAAKKEAGRPASLALRLEQEEVQVQLTPHLANYQATAEYRVGELPEKLSMALEARAGMLVVNECNLHRRAEQWLESGILPLLYEIWEITESECSGMKMAILNVHNRVALMVADDATKKVDLSKLELDATIQVFMPTLDNSERELELLERLVRRRLNLEFKIGPLFSGGRSFISGAAPSTFEQFNRNKLLRDAQKWSQKQVRRVRNFIRLVEQEESLSTSEKCVRYIQSRQGEDSDSQYAGIFLTRGYIGESFCVGREDEIAHFARVASQWEKGYRGSVCITGKRLSGKSLFGELVAHRFFPESTIRIAPGETIRIEGRRITLGSDLDKALTDIRKITLNNRPLIWIDDLELWQDPAIPLNQNVRALRRFLDNYSTDMFFMVSMGNWLRAYLDRFHPLDRLFQSEINLDKMGAANIREAIWVRHTATNRRLVDQEGRELTPQQVSRLTKRIYRASEGVVGDALNYWSASTLSGEDNTVTNAFSDNYSLPDFVTPESGLILAYIMLQKRSQEYHLRKYFGPTFPDKYAPVLKRLISVGILERQLDHSLEINKLVVTELGSMLEYHEHLQYQRWKS